MKTKIEVCIGCGTKRPKVVKSGNGWVVVGEAESHVPYGRALWVRTAKSGSDKWVDGKGFLVGPTGRLTKG